jgi:choline dehydrogenase-like flavoprotein
LAREFSGTSISVLVLESGGSHYDPSTQQLAGGEIVGLPYFPLETTRLRWLGGTTNHYGGVTRVMEPEDFEPNPVAPHTGWPIRRAELDSYYERARVVCGLPYGESTLPALIKRDRFPFLPLAPERFITRVGQIVPKEARSFRTMFEKELEASANVTLHCGANVTEIETNAPGTMATRVHAATLAGNRFTVAARRVILAAGGIENARVLLASNRQWPRGVGNHHDQVGRFFMEHPRFIGGIIVPARPNLSIGVYQHHRLGGTGLQGYLAMNPELRRREGLVDVQMVLRPAYVGSFERATQSSTMDEARQLAIALRRRRDLDDLGRHLARVARDLMTWQSVTIPGAPLPVPFPELVGQVMRSTPPEAQALIPGMLGDIVANVYAQAIGAPLDHIMVRTRIDPAPNPASRVTLSHERDALGMPKTRLDWRLSAIDHASVRRTLELLGAEVGRAGLGRLRIVLEGDDNHWPADLAGGYHHMGTTRMSDDPKHGVVDRHARVHGIANLYVAGSSVFTSAGSGTPTLTAVALALRLADHLKGAAA